MSHHSKKEQKVQFLNSPKQDGIKNSSDIGFLCTGSVFKCLSQTWANNSTGEPYSSITRQLDNNLGKYTWQINGHFSHRTQLEYLFLIELRLNLDITALIIASRKNLESLPQFAKVWFEPIALTIVSVPTILKPNHQNTPPQNFQN